MKRIEEFNSQVYLVNTGWTGGPYGVGKRFDIPVTRSVISAIQTGSLLNAETETIEGINLEVPKEIEGIESNLLNPIKNWENKESYYVYQENLVEEFTENFKRFDVSEAIVKAGPNLS